MVWWLNRALHQGRDYACDHTVLSSGTEPSLHARHLLPMAESFNRQPRQGRLALTNGLFLATATGFAKHFGAPCAQHSVLQRRQSHAGGLWLDSDVLHGQHGLGDGDITPRSTC